jgi:hypothetical protein
MCIVRSRTAEEARELHMMSKIKVLLLLLLLFHSKEREMYDGIYFLQILSSSGLHKVWNFSPAQKRALGEFAIFLAPIFFRPLY